MLSKSQRSTAANPFRRHPKNCENRLKGYVAGRAAPIIQITQDGIPAAGAYVNPIPAGLVLTGIVVSVSVTAFALSLTLRLRGLRNPGHR